MPPHPLWTTKVGREARYVMFFTRCSRWSASIEIYYFPAINPPPPPLLYFIIPQPVYQFVLLPV